MYSLCNIGMTYPGFDTDSKTHLYTSVCLPILMYGFECIALSNKNINDIQNAQGSVMKQVCGLHTKSHHSQLLKALNISTARGYITNSTMSMFHRICSNVPQHVIYACIYYLCFYQLISQNMVPLLID